MVRKTLSYEIEESLWRSGYQLVAGVDEAGRGPLAGPVVAAAVIISPENHISGLNDSKVLTQKQREELYQKIKAEALSVAVGQASWEEIDRINILRATHLAMRRAIGSLKIQPEFLIIDGLRLPDRIYPQKAVVHGDRISPSIAAASIIAKVTRDRIMKDYDTVFPEYGFASHKGYGTRRHREAIKKYGPSPIHRLSFSGVKEYYLPPREMQNRRRLGFYAEQLAAYHLFSQGYRIIQRNYRAGAYGEIDLVVEKDSLIAFVEVKSKQSTASPDPLEHVDSRKQEQLFRIAEHYLMDNPEQGREYRFDVVTVNFGPERTVIKHLPDAFRL